MIVPHTMNEASEVEQIEFQLLEALGKLKDAKERINSIGAFSRGDLALKLADAQGALIYGIREVEDAISHYSLAEALIPDPAATHRMAA